MAQTINTAIVPSFNAYLAHTALKQPKKLTWKIRTIKARRALSLIPERPIRVNIPSIIMAPTKVGKGRATSPARYEEAVAADTTDVEA